MSSWATGPSARQGSWLRPPPSHCRTSEVGVGWADPLSHTARSHSWHPGAPTVGSPSWGTHEGLTQPGHHLAPPGPAGGSPRLPHWCSCGECPAGLQLGGRRLLGTSNMAMLGLPCGPSALYSHVQLPVHCEVRGAAGDPDLPQPGGEEHVSPYVPVSPLPQPATDPWPHAGAQSSWAPCVATHWPCSSQHRGSMSCPEAPRRAREGSRGPVWVTISPPSSNGWKGDGPSGRRGKGQPNLQHLSPPPGIPNQGVSPVQRAQAPHGPGGHQVPLPAPAPWLQIEGDP